MLFIVHKKNGETIKKDVKEIGERSLFDYSLKNK
jgi:hypothetical protein